MLGGVAGLDEGTGLEAHPVEVEAIAEVGGQHGREDASRVPRIGEDPAERGVVTLVAHHDGRGSSAGARPDCGLRREPLARQPSP